MGRARSDHSGQHIVVTTLPEESVLERTKDVQYHESQQCVGEVAVQRLKYRESRVVLRQQLCHAYVPRLLAGEKSVVVGLLGASLHRCRVCRS